MATSELARFCSEPVKLPPAVARVTRHCLLDWTGCVLGALDDPLRVLLMKEAQAQGGHPQATVLGSALRVSTVQAALINGTASHVLDFDDTHLAMPGHPSAPVVAAALAVAEERSSSGAELIEAIAVGIEVECRIGLFMGPSHYRSGWNASGTLGTFGACAAAGRLLGIGAERMAVSFGLAATQATALQSMIRSMAMPFHCGKAAFNGILSARLAARGMTASLDILERPQGFAALHHGDFQTERALERLSDAWLVPDTLFKYHAGCYGVHPAIEATRVVAREVPLEEVEQVEVSVSPFISRLCVVMEPEDVIGMKFSIPHNVAMTLAGRDTGDAASYTASAISDPQLQALRRKVRVTVDPTFTDWRTRVVLVSRAYGRHPIDVDLEQPNRDLDDQERRLLAKFLLITRPILGEKRSSALAGALLEVERLANVAALPPLCAG